MTKLRLIQKGEMLGTTLIKLPRVFAGCVLPDQGIDQISRVHFGVFALRGGGCSENHCCNG